MIRWRFKSSTVRWLRSYLFFSHGFGVVYGATHTNTNTHMKLLLLVIAFLFNLLRMSTGFEAHNVCSFFRSLFLCLCFCFSSTVHVKCAHPKITCHSFIHSLTRYRNEPMVFPWRLLKCKMLKKKFMSRNFDEEKHTAKTCVEAKNKCLEPCSNVFFFWCVSVFFRQLLNKKNL